MMVPDSTKLLAVAGITIPLIGFYDVADPAPFTPLVHPEHCYFSCYNDWLDGFSVCLSTKVSTCKGCDYWIGGASSLTREEYGKLLNRLEGFKSSDELMCRWLDNLTPYRINNGYVVIGPLRDDQYHSLKTVTFFVNPDQLSLLLIGVEYHNAFVCDNPVTVAFGSGCAQMGAVFDNFDPQEPRAVIGATDIAMRIHLPPDLLALTVNVPMYEQLCALDEESFLYKKFWGKLKELRAKTD